MIFLQHILYDSERCVMESEVFRGSQSFNLINEIGDLRFLSGAISQKRTEIVDFTDFYETFWSECRERNERSPKRRPGSPKGNINDLSPFL